MGYDAAKCSKFGHFQAHERASRTRCYNIHRHAVRITHESLLFVKFKLACFSPSRAASSNNLTHKTDLPRQASTPACWHAARCTPLSWSSVAPQKSAACPGLAFGPRPHLTSHVTTADVTSHHQCLAVRKESITRQDNTLYLSDLASFQSSPECLISPHIRCI